VTRNEWITSFVGKFINLMEHYETVTFGQIVSPWPDLTVLAESVAETAYEDNKGWSLKTPEEVAEDEFWNCGNE
jgi:hypothetical protein